jgi:hypothetical protein
MACGITIPVQVKTGPTVTDEIHVPLSASVNKAYVVRLSFGVGNFNLGPGAQDAVVSGTATYNVSDFKPKVTINQNVIDVEQGNLNVGGIPNFEKKIKNDWDLELGDASMRLQINAGAYSGKYELGGLALESLSISDGAADVNLTFSEPNRIDMETFQYSTGASDVTLTGLANAHFAEMKFRSGAGDYTLDFSGELKYDASVEIESGLSSVTVIVPAQTAANISFEGGLTSVDTSGKWEKQGSQYIQAGSGPTLTIKIKMGAGSLTIKNP